MSSSSRFSCEILGHHSPFRSTCLSLCQCPDLKSLKATWLPCLPARLAWESWGWSSHRLTTRLLSSVPSRLGCSSPYWLQCQSSYRTFRSNSGMPYDTPRSSSCRPCAFFAVSWCTLVVPYILCRFSVYFAESPCPSTLIVLPFILAFFASCLYQVDWWIYPLFLWSGLLSHYHHPLYPLPLLLWIQFIQPSFRLFLVLLYPFTLLEPGLPSIAVGSRQRGYR